MASSRARPWSGKSLEEAVREEKWAFVAYSGLGTRANTSRWHRVAPGLWSYVRYLLEAYGAPHVEQMADQQQLDFQIMSDTAQMSKFDMIRGFVGFHRQFGACDASGLRPELLGFLQNVRTSGVGPELSGDKWLAVNMFVFLVRCPMPHGAHAWTPLEVTKAYAELEDRAREQPDNARLQEGLAALRRRHKTFSHGADRPVAMRTYGSDSARCTRFVSVPPDDYMCPVCKTFGDHYERACAAVRDRASVETPAALMPFGPNKFQEAKLLADTDAAMFSILHKRRLGLL